MAGLIRAGGTISGSFSKVMSESHRPTLAGVDKALERVPGFEQGHPGIVDHMTPSSRGSWSSPG